MNGFKSFATAFCFIFLTCNGSYARAYEQLSSGNSRCAVRLYQALAEEESGNFVFAARPTTAVLRMLQAGARSETLEELNNFFGDAFSPQEIAQGCLSLDQATRRDIKIGNGIFPSTSLCSGKEGEYFDRYQDLFAVASDTTYIRDFDYETNPENARSTINAWIEERCEIAELLPDNAINGATRLVIASTALLKKEWSESFSYLSEPQPFYDETGGVIGHALYMEDIDAYEAPREYCSILLDAGEVVALKARYQSGSYAMYFILPPAGVCLAAFERNHLDAELLHRIIMNREYYKCRGRIVPFKNTASVDVQSTLQKNDVVKMFQAGVSDFSGINGVSDSEALYIDCIYTRAEIEVNQQGCIAKGATVACMMDGACHMDKQEQRLISFDRPHLYIIADSGTGDIAFMGRVVDPVSLDQKVQKRIHDEESEWLAIKELND